MFGDVQVDQNKLQELEDHQNTFDHDHCLMDLISKLTASTAAKSQQEDSEACTAFNSGYNGYFGQLRACQASPYMGRVLPEPSTIVPFQMTTRTQTAEPPTLKNGMTNRGDYSLEIFFCPENSASAPVESNAAEHLSAHIPLYSITRSTDIKIECDKLIGY